MFQSRLRQRRSRLLYLSGLISLYFIGFAGGGIASDTLTISNGLDYVNTTKWADCAAVAFLVISFALLMLRSGPALTVQAPPESLRIQSEPEPHPNQSKPLASRCNARAEQRPFICAQRNSIPHPTPLGHPPPPPPPPPTPPTPTRDLPNPFNYMYDSTPPCLINCMSDTHGNR